MTKLIDDRGKVAIMATSGCKDFLNQIPPHSTFVNKAPARTWLEFLVYSPNRHSHKIQIPIYYAICQKDNLAPAKATLACAKQSKHPTIKEYNCGHFDIYLGHYFEEAIKDYIFFLSKIIN